MSHGVAWWSYREGYLRSAVPAITLPGMFRNLSARLCTLIAPMLLLSNVSDAGTLSIVGAKIDGVGPPFSPGSVSACTRESTTSAVCAISASEPYYRWGGFISITASSSFGSVAANGDVEDDRYGLLTASFSAEFSDFLQVTGGSGAGTLVAHFAWDARATHFPEIPATPPSFSVVAGKSRSSWTPALSITPTSGLLDVSSPFIFVDLLAIGGATTGNMLAGNGESEYLGSSLNVTGYSIFDANGNSVSGAVVTPQGVPNVNFFVPEPGCSILFPAGSLALLVIQRRRVNRSKSGVPERRL